MMSDYIKNKRISFSKSIDLCLKNINNYKGRSRRSEFWWPMLLFVISLDVMPFLMPYKILWIPLDIFIIFLVYFTIAVTVRRLHDVGLSGWWFLMVTVITAVTNILIKYFPNRISDTTYAIFYVIEMIVGFAFIVILALDSQKKTNKYGPSTKYSQITNS